MSDHQRNLYILIGSVVCVALGVVTYLWVSLSRPPARDEGGVLGASLHPLDMPPIQAPKLERRYQGIVERNFFKPLEGEVPVEPETESAPPPEEPRQAARPSRSSPSVVYGAPAFPDLYAPMPGISFYGPSAGLPSVDWQEPLTSPPQPPAPMDPSSPTAGQPQKGPTGPPAADVAVTAVVRGGDGRARVLVEDNATGESKWVEPGGRAFGYRVDYATEKGSVLTRDGRQYVLGVGENKPAAAPKADVAPTPGGSSSSAAPGEAAEGGETP